MSIDYTKPVKVDGRTGFVATGVEHVPNVRGPIREFLGMMTPAAVAMIVVAALVLLSACGPDTDKTPEPAPNVAAVKSAPWHVDPEDFPASAGVPRCQQEDGSNQRVCWWYDKANGTFVNMDYGRYTYVTETGDLIGY